MSVLVIGYGNTLRRDDGAGPWVASRFENDPRVRVLTTQHLVPELADDLSKHDRVIFIDAIANAAEDVSFARIEPSEKTPSLGHAADPGWLLALTQALCGRAPHAWLLAIRGDDFGYGDELSPAMVVRAEQAIRRLQTFLDEPRS